MTRTITAYFDSRSDAQVAAERLRDAGLRPGDFSIHAKEAPAADAARAEAAQDERGFFGRIADFFLPDEDRATYAEGLRRGGSILTVRSDAIPFERIADIVEEAGAVDLDTREAEWRSQGWTGAGLVPGTSGFGRDDGTSRTGGVDTARGDFGTAGDRSREANRMTEGTMTQSATTEGAMDQGTPVQGSAAQAGGLGAGSAAGAIAGRDEATDPQPGRVGAPSSVQGSTIDGRGTLGGGGGQGLTPDPDGMRTGRREMDHGRTRLRSYVSDDLPGAGDGADRIRRTDVELDDRRGELSSEADRLRRGV